MVAGVWYPDGAFYRADLVTELLPDAVSLADLLFSGPRNRDSVALLAETGRLIAFAGRNGILHADLNARNVVFSESEKGRQGYLLDLDRAVVEPPSGRAHRRDHAQPAEPLARQAGQRGGRAAHPGRDRGPLGRLPCLTETAGSDHRPARSAS